MRPRLLCLMFVTFVVFQVGLGPQRAHSFLDLPIPGMVNVVDFGAKTCIPCKMMEPILEELHKDYKGTAAIVFVDVRYYGDLARKYRIRGIPTQIFFDKEGREVYRHVGFMEKKSIVRQLRRMGVSNAVEAR